MRNDLSLQNLSAVQQPLLYPVTFPFYPGTAAHWALPFTTELQIMLRKHSKTYTEVFLWILLLWDDKKICQVVTVKKNILYGS